MEIIKVLHVLCEGHTEECFCKQVLKEYLEVYDIKVKPQVLYTNKKKNGRGGLSNFSKVERDLTTMFNQFNDTANEQHWFTTMFDFYSLPNDFPGYQKQCANHRLRVANIENELGGYFGHKRFIPYIQLHEFEALVFAGLDKLKLQYPPGRKLDKSIEQLKKALRQHNDDPEEVNDSPNTAPSKRIISAFTGLHKYNKKMVGPDVVKAIGIDGLKTKCKHFAQWMTRLEKL